MWSTTRPRAVLVVDSDSKFIQSLKQDPLATTTPLVQADSGKTAQLTLANADLSLAGIFLNPAACDSPDWVSVVRFAHLRRAATPVYLILDPGAQPPDLDLKKLAVHEILKKPLVYAKLVEKVVPPSIKFDSKKALSEADSKAAADPAGAEVPSDDSEYAPIRAEDFLSGTKSFFNVYVRLTSGRHIKILQAGDTFTPDRVIGYLNKGVTHFYLEKSAQSNYLSYCDQLASSLLKAKAAPMKVKVTQTLNHGEETLNFLRTNGLQESSLQFASSFVGNVGELVKQVKMDQDKFMQGFLGNLAHYDHGVMTTALTAMLARHFKIESAKAVEMVGLAAIMHDVGLYKIFPETFVEDESKMDEPTKGIFRTHPVLGAEYLRTFTKVDPAAVQAVAQHHERRNRKGFPERSKTQPANRISEIVGICDEFAHLIKRTNEEPTLNPFHEMEERIFDGFTTPMIQAFKETFMLGIG